MHVSSCTCAIYACEVYARLCVCIFGMVAKIVVTLRPSDLFVSTVMGPTRTCDRSWRCPPRVALSQACCPRRGSRCPSWLNKPRRRCPADHGLNKRRRCGNREKPAMPHGETHEKKRIDMSYACDKWHNMLYMCVCVMLCVVL